MRCSQTKPHCLHTVHKYNLGKHCLSKMHNNVYYWTASSHYLSNYTTCNGCTVLRGFLVKALPRDNVQCSVQKSAWTSCTVIKCLLRLCSSRMSSVTKCSFYILSCEWRKMNVHRDKKWMNFTVKPFDHGSPDMKSRILFSLLSDFFSVLFLVCHSSTKL